MEIAMLVFALLIPVIFLLILFGWLMPISLIVSAAAAKVAVTPLDIIGMRLRSVNPHTIVKAAIRLKQAGIEPGPDQSEQKPKEQPQQETYDGDDEEMLELIRLEAADKNPQPLHRLEAHYLAGGNPEKLVNSLIEAKKRKIDLPFTIACSVDLRGGNIMRLLAALEEARKRNVELDLNKAVQIEISIAEKERK
ncbi:MAG: hypothetical protein CVV42_04215 [Candidatus Riflebacteria bacterium HGW-Riflebacteria-2]|jgi:uncharacterized protein YqfA (UPF0365 family)|nr:MAG: hypothetical protein CVV42_04215 [Candidatus Riflebacteria bacterium HGW-Riflebacteria-2]